MWIRSQDKETLTDVKHLSIRYLNGCYAIFTDNHLAPNEMCNLGIYKTKEKALKVLDGIQRFIDNKCSMLVFEMPEDDSEDDMIRSRLTKKNDKKYFKEHIACPEYNDYQQFIKDRPYRIDYHTTKVETKLGKLEDLMEKYDIKSLEQLEKIMYHGIKSYFSKKGEKTNE